MERKECFGVVITAEIKSQRLYRTLAKSFKTPETSAIFQELVILEKNHEEKVRSLFSVEFPEHEPQIGSLAEPGLGGLALSEPVDVLRFAISREDMAAEKYRELADGTEESGSKALLLGFAVEEEQHKQVLLTEIQRLQGAFTWYDPSELSGLMED